MSAPAARSCVNVCLLLAVLVAGCAGKEKDPLDDIKALIPKVEAGLNRRDLAGLKGMGTERFESNAFVIDVFGDRVHDSVSLSLDRINQTGNEAVLIMKMAPRQGDGAKRQLSLRLIADGKWEIDGYVIATPQPDTAGGQNP